MHSEGANTMQNEITELRNQVRTLKRIVYGFGCLLVAGVVVSATSVQSVPDVIQAKKFEVVNDEGKSVARLSANEDGGYLSVCNKDGQVVALHGADENGGYSSICNKDGIPVAGLAVKEYGSLLSIANKDGKMVVGLGVGEYGGALMTLDNKGNLTSQLP
jgi:hypothetical protein